MADPAPPPGFSLVTKDQPAIKLPPGFTLQEATPTPGTDQPAIKLPPGFTLQEATPTPGTDDEKVYYNDAGQPFTMNGRAPPSKDEDGYTGSILPLRTDPEGHLHLAVPEAIAAPVRGAVEGGQRAIGAGERGQDPLRPLSPDALATVGALAGNPVAGMADRGMLGPSTLEAGGRLVPRHPPEASSALAAEQRSNMVQGRAAEIIAKKFAEGVKGGAPTAMDTIDELFKARGRGQPLTLSDIVNPEVRSMIGTVYREGGPARSVLRNFYEDRNAAATGRVEGLINSYLSDESLRQTEKSLIEARSAHALPLWDKAAEGGSIAPLEQQFTTFFNEATTAEREASASVAAANQAVTNAAAKQSTAGNVYSTSASNAARREADVALKTASARLATAQQNKAAILAKLRAAQADQSANAPGAVWSPRIQQFLDDPDFKSGLARGMANERRAALGEGRPMTGSEYAVVGTDPEGNPIVGEVPSMRVLMVAKEGLDAIIEDEVNPTTGRPTKRGVSFLKMREGLLNELDKLNPDYKIARDQWSGETGSIMAAQSGRHIFDEKWFPSQDALIEKFGEMSANDKQFFIIGVADKLKNMLYRSVDSADKGRIINNERVRRLLRPLFSSDEEAQAFIEAMERERTMRGTPGDIYGNSRTAERAQDDSRASAAMHLAHGIARLFQGRYLSSAMSAWRTYRLLGGNADPEVSEAIARMVTDPDIALSGHGNLFPRPRYPTSPATVSAPTVPSMSYGLAPGTAVGNDRNQ